MNIYWWQGIQGGGLKDVLITHNTFINSREDTNIQINDGPHQNVQISYNVFLQEDELPISLVTPSEGLNMHHNLWSKAPNLFANGVGDIIGSYPSWAVFARWTGRGSMSWLNLASSLSGFNWENQSSLMSSDVMPCGKYTYNNMSQNFCN